MNPEKKRANEHYGCGIEIALDIIGNKWKGAVLFHLLDEKKRFNELRRLIPQVTQRMLTLQLRELEKHAVINRKVYAEVPPKVEYSLTKLGRTLKPILLNLKAWGDQVLNNNKT